MNAYSHIIYYVCYKFSSIDIAILHVHDILLKIQGLSQFAINHWTNGQLNSNKLHAYCFISEMLDATPYFALRCASPGA